MSMTDLLAMCRPRGFTRGGCPYDGLGCTYSACRRDINAKTVGGFGCKKQWDAERRAARTNEQTGEKR